MMADTHASARPHVLPASRLPETVGRRRLGVIGALAALLWACNVANAEPFRIVITERVTPLLPNSVIELAQRLGYFEREGVDVRLVRVDQTPLAVAAMKNDGGEMADISVEAAVALAARQPDDLKAVMSANARFPYIIAAQAAVRSPQDLKGRTFGIGRIGSLDHALTLEVLRARGLDPGTVRLVGLGQPDVRLMALVAGRIDATTVSLGTWTALPAKAGLHVLVAEQDFAAAAPVISKVLVVPRRVLEQRRESVVAVVTALIRASRDFAANPSAWTAAMATLRPDVRPVDLAHIAEALKDRWSINGGLTRGDAAFTTDWLYRGPDFASLPRVSIRAWTEFGILDTVLAEIGVDHTGETPAR